LSRAWRRDTGQYFRRLELRTAPPSDVLGCLPVMHRCVRISSALGFGSRVSSRLLLSRSQSVTKELSGGWYQVLNKGEEYFWHKPSNKTAWTLPADIPLQTASFADTASRNREHTHSGSHGERRADLESQTRADSDLPEGWTAVHSAEHGREYYWHEASKSTMWDKPALSPRHVSAELERVLKEHGYINLTLVIAGLLYRYKPGETLNTADFDLLHGVLGYHPDYPRKLGGGVRSIKVDVAPIVAPTSDKDQKAVLCFWCVRSDGSTKPFLWKKCLRPLLDRTE